ncbi:GH36 C-terminal domain-containing protein [Isoptericola sp. NPDC056134]|uniref:GH36 C-terminal domain-containing protein n=1 Tax=Isoptericola sp. NPDC056134 TaxID=3345723 RepID=UPI0035EEDC2B
MWGVVATDRSRALFQVATLTRPATAPPGRLTLRGLDPARRYRVTPLPLSGEAYDGWSVPPWLRRPEGTVLTGRTLAVAGLQTPESAPETALVLRVEAVG